MRVIITGAHTPDLVWLAQHLPALLPEADVSWLDHRAILNWLESQARDESRLLLSGLDQVQVREQSALQTIDADLRQALAKAGMAYGVVYGQGLQRLLNAQRLVQPQDLPQRAAWVCDKCSDPDCEFKLFTGLKGLKAANPQAL